MGFKVSCYMQDYLAVVQNITFDFGCHRGSVSKIRYYVN
ncbi:hypothetical protein PP176A_1940 [Sporanaerobacter sp. PP17-6a]|nr:hypothetical protein PP176A_1940 [Sporanaerobacter sp. PP17-6a]